MDSKTKLNYGIKMSKTDSNNKINTSVDMKKPNRFYNLIKRFFKNQIPLIYIGGILGFIFWLPLLSFIAVDIWGVWANVLIAAFFALICYFFIAKNKKLEIITDNPKILISNNNINSFYKTYIAKFISQEPNITIPKITNTVCIAICITFLHIMHKNPYIAVSLSYLVSIAILLFPNRKYRFYIGFFIGAFGFYWMALSLRFEQASEFIPALIVCIGLIYAIIFSIIFFFQNVWIRIIAILSLSIIHPFGFNWLNLAYFSAYSIFTPSLASLACLCVCLVFITMKNRLSVLSILLAIISYDYNFTKQNNNLSQDGILKIIRTNYSQDYRWLEENKESIIKDNIDQIDKAIQEGYKMVLLPETSFTFNLNKRQDIIELLLEKSKNIVIYAGGLRLQDIDTNNTNINKHNKDISSPYYIDSKLKWNEEIISPIILGLTSISKRKDSLIVDISPKLKHIKSNNKNIINANQELGYYNSYYVFASSSIYVADKTILVPFGETLPMSKYLDIDFGFNAGDRLLSLVWNDYNITIANCYEATFPSPYKTGAKHILVGSNNAWFAPSTQHFMQQMIIKYYARHYQSFIYHATNITSSAIITPNNGSDSL
ncbi:nitrilase-related carbon-nitrogen hydrolase [Helicobacter muridarum]|nr:nitrilase-related carbon-nitrogen hydrolase [Helicobacter muridarum]STQ87023.1 apolipoprotein N-acyltransferase [Helicobacter muridarum]